MPRGKPRKGQFVFALYFPMGGHYKVESTHDMTFDEWKAEVVKQLDELKTMVMSPAQGSAK